MTVGIAILLLQVLSCCMGCPFSFHIQYLHRFLQGSRVRHVSCDLEGISHLQCARLCMYNYALKVATSIGWWVPVPLPPKVALCGQHLNGRPVGIALKATFKLPDRAGFKGGGEEVWPH